MSVVHCLCCESSTITPPLPLGQFNHTSQECFLGDSLLKQVKEIRSFKKHGRQGERLMAITKTLRISETIGHISK